MEQEEKKIQNFYYKLAIIIGVAIVIAGIIYFAVSTTQAIPNLPQAQDIYKKTDHFRFEASYQFLDARTNVDIDKAVRNELQIDFYRQTDSGYKKALRETYKDESGQLVEVITVNNADDPIVYMAIQSSNTVKLNQFQLTEWNQVVEYDSFDINNDDTNDDVFKLDITDAKNYYQLEGKEREYAKVLLMIPITYNYQQIIPNLKT